MKNVINEIIAKKRESIYDLRCHNTVRVSDKSFKKALKKSRIAIIAEIKRASPSRGSIAAIPDPLRLLSQYLAGGADAISVLTEEHYFSGSYDDLANVSKHTNIPILQKDFILEPAQIDLAISLGADAVLLIVMAVGSSLSDLLSYCHAKNIEAVVEVTSVDEIELALQAGAEILQINNRDLRTLSIHPLRCHQLITEIPAHLIRIAASGYANPEEVQELERLGFNAVLIGEALSAHPNPTELLQAYRSQV